MPEIVFKGKEYVYNHHLTVPYRPLVADAAKGIGPADLAGSGVRVNSVLPKVIDTAANRQAMPGAATAGWTTPESIARVIRFLCSDDAAAIHGAAIPVYGGG